LRKSVQEYGPIDEDVAAEEEVEEDEDLVFPPASASSVAQPPVDEDATSSSSTAETADDPTTTTAAVVGGGVDIAALARAINQAFSGSVLAELYEIEVTTPGATSDELSGIMWQSYRGFDVIATYTHPKTNKLQTLEGRLVERTADHTILNLKGRLKKLDNDTVQSVKLPPAKKEPLL
jgi:hypothetical protein